MMLKFGFVKQFIDEFWGDLCFEGFVFFDDFVSEFVVDCFDFVFEVVYVGFVGE